MESRLLIAPTGTDDLGEDILNVPSGAHRRSRFAVGGRSVLKTAFDGIGAAILLVFLLPLLMLIAVSVKLGSGGPVLFRQKRWGLDGSVIGVYKFRTMYADREDQMCQRQTTRGDARVTPVGRFLRRTSLDELPQLLNVLKGEMSLVGPRPHALGMTVNGQPNAEIVPTYFDRYRVKPGITGWAQINGYRGAVDSAEHLAHRVNLDLHYIQNWSLWLDVKILFLTVFKVFSDRNAF